MSTTKTGPVKILVFGDMHIATSPPAARKPNYLDELGDCLWQVYLAAKANKVDAVACPGDWFHRKQGTTHADVRWAIEALRKLSNSFGPVLTVFGNHDMLGNQAADAGTSQPVGVLVSAGVIRDVATAPWAIARDGKTYRVCGAPFSKDIMAVAAALESACSVPIKDNATNHAATVALTHVEAIDSATRHALATGASNGSLLPGSLTIVNGHIHERGLWKVRHRFNGATGEALFLNTGSVSRTSIAEADFQPAMTLLTLAGASVATSKIPFKVMPRAEAFIEPGESVGPVAEARFTDFLRALRTQAGPAADLGTTIRTVGARMGLGEKVIEEALRLVKENH